MDIISSFSAKGILNTLLLAPVALYRIWKFLKDHRITAVNFHYPSLSALSVAVLKRLGAFQGKLVLSFHGTDVRTPARGVEARAWSFLLETSDAITACSNSLARQVGDIYGIDTGRVTVIYNGVDTNVFCPALAATKPTTAAVSATKPYIVSIGSYIERKGHRFLIEAFCAIKDRYPSIGLIIVGGYGAELVATQVHVDSVGLVNRVTLLVDQTPADVARVVAGAAMCVQPSLAEPFGLAVIEAGACNVPVIATAVGGHVELIEHSVNGLLVPSADSAAITQAIDYLLTNQNETKVLAKNFRTTILKKFSWEKCAVQYLTVVNDVTRC